MPITSSATKALRQTKRKTLMNRDIRSRVKSASDALKAKPTQASLAEAYSSIDKSVKRNILHKNKAARLKSQLSRLMPKK